MHLLVVSIEDLQPLSTAAVGARLL